MMEAALATEAPAPAPAPVDAPSPSSAEGNVTPESFAPLVDAPKQAPSTPRDFEVPVDLDHPKDAQPDLRDVFPDQPQPKEAAPERERAEPERFQQPEGPEPLPLPDVFAANERDAEAWGRMPREWQEAFAGTIEATRAQMQPQLEAATQTSQAHAEALWGAIGIHSQKARALLELARSNPQQLETFAQSPDGQRFINEVAAERQQIQHHGAQVLQQMQEAQRVQSEQLQKHYDDVWAPQQDEQFWERATFIPAGQEEAVQDHSLETLRNAGFSDDEISEAYERSGMMRDHRAQTIIAKATLWDMEQARRAQAKAAAKERDRRISQAQPRPLSPGTGANIMPPSQTLAAAAASGDMRNYIRLRNAGAIR
jgi:hypothetical protein